MSKKIAFILLALSFITGFMLRDMLIGVSSGSDSPRSKSTVTDEKIKEMMENQGPIFEIVKLAMPRKAVRGNSLELITDLKALRNSYGNYGLLVYIYNECGSVRIKSGPYPLLGNGRWSVGDNIRLGPFRVSIPDETPLGKYRVDFGLMRQGALLLGNIKNSSSTKTIEIIKF